MTSRHTEPDLSFPSSVLCWLTTPSPHRVRAHNFGQFSKGVRRRGRLTAHQYWDGKYGSRNRYSATCKGNCPAARRGSSKCRPQRELQGAISLPSFYTCRSAQGLKPTLFRSIKANVELGPAPRMLGTPRVRSEGRSRRQLRVAYTVRG